MKAWPSPKSNPKNNNSINTEQDVERLLATMGEWYSSRQAVAPANRTAEQNEVVPHGVVYTHFEPGREAVFAAPQSGPLHPRLQKALAAQGIDKLYSHQAEAVDALRDKKHLALVTSTASGKTLCYNLPVLETCLAEYERLRNEPPGYEYTRPLAPTALYIFPVNALLNDQHKTLVSLIQSLGPEVAPKISAARYSGNTPTDEKKQIRRTPPNVLLTNPEMVNLSLLGWHHLWADFLRNLKYIVLDEVHTYRGIFGSHIAHLMRRLRRVCASYGANPQFVTCSATIGNPLELITDLVGLPGESFHLIPPERAGSRHPPRHYAVLSPPPFMIKQEPVKYEGAVPKPGATQQAFLTLDVPVYRSTTEEAAELATWVMSEAPDLSMLCFARARASAETMVRMCRAGLPSKKAEQVKAYRAGLLAEERVSIEQKLKGGELKAVFSTNALELGVDIGGLDAVLMAGYPGSQMATSQQAGRAGRGLKPALVFVLMTRTPLDQYFARNPQALFNNGPEKAYINPLNGHVAMAHLLAAAKELPLSESDLAKYYPPAMRSWVRRLTQPSDDSGTTKRPPGVLVEGQDRTGRKIWKYADNDDERGGPQKEIGLRSSSGEKYEIVDRDSGRTVGTIEPPAVFREAHPGAVYVHAGDTYRVEELNEKTHQVLVYPIVEDTSTDRLSEASVNVVKIADSRKLNFTTPPLNPKMEIGSSWGWLVAHEKIIGYKLGKLYRRRNGDSESVRDNEFIFETPYTFETRTTGMWLNLPSHAAFGPVGDYEAGVIALENILTGLFPVQIMCDRNDIGSAHLIDPESGATIYFYDNYEGGAGMAAGHFDKVYELLDAAYIAILKCDCRDGCPSCVQSGSGANRHERADKRAALRMLAKLLDRTK